MTTEVDGRSNRIQGDGMYFQTGTLSSGVQVLMGVQLPDLVAVEFDRDGSYLRTARRNILTLSPPVQGDSMPQNDAWIGEQVRQWQIELGFVDATIVVKPFFLSDDWIGISDLPEHYQHVIDHPDAYEVDRYEELSGDIRLWRERGDFVLYWDEEYYLNRDGELQSS